MNSNDAFKDRLQRAFARSPFGSQKELAEALEVREATVSNWFSGSWPREDQMKALVQVLGASGHWLLTGEGSMQPSDDRDAYRLQVIGKIADGKISPETLQGVEELHRLESSGATAEEIEKSMQKIRSDASRKAQS